jgi:hypothetical protein
MNLNMSQLLCISAAALNIGMAIINAKTERFDLLIINLIAVAIVGGAIALIIKTK